LKEPAIRKMVAEQGDLFETRKRIDIFVDSPVPGGFTIPAVAYG
jgi:hypothetical protein